MGQVEVYVRIFGDCREKLIPRCLQRGYWIINNLLWMESCLFAGVFINKKGNRKDGE